MPALNPRAALAARLQRAVAKAFGEEHANVDAMVRRSERADFQAWLKDFRCTTSPIADTLRTS